MGIPAPEACSEECMSVPIFSHIPSIFLGGFYIDWAVGSRVSSTFSRLAWRNW